MRITVLIPACGRAPLLREALLSVGPQLREGDRVVVSDDGPTSQVEWVQSVAPNTRYIHNERPKGQVGNVNALWQATETEFALLLHDDDRLAPGALERLRAALLDRPDAVAAFGMQRVIGPDGVERSDDAKRLNDAFWRSPSDPRSFALSPLECGLVGQFPNDGYLIRAEVARALGYSDDPGVGDACDYDFGVRLGALGRPMLFVPVETMEYRVHPSSVSVRRDNNAGINSYLIALKALAARDATPAIEERLRERAPGAMKQACRLYRLRDARIVLGSKPFRRCFPRASFWVGSARFIVAVGAALLRRGQRRS